MPTGLIPSLTNALFAAVILKPLTPEFDRHWFLVTWQRNEIKFKVVLWGYGSVMSLTEILKTSGADRVNAERILPEEATRGVLFSF